MNLGRGGVQVGLAGVLLAALTLPAVLARQSGAPANLATLTVGATGTAIVPTAVNGFNVPYDMSVAEALEAVHSVAPTSLRYPPGNVGDEQDLTLAGLRSFQSTLKLAGPQAQATVETRVFATRADAGNSPEDAAQAARDARTLGLKVLYWEIGNEPDLYSRNRGDASWTPQRYCGAFRAQRAAILKVDPAARFAGPAVSNVSGDGGSFLTEFVRQCGDIVDLLSWHEYPTSGDQSDEAALATAGRVTEHLNTFKALLKDPASNPLGFARTIPVGVTEYSLSYVSNRMRHLSDMVGALWAAETTARLAEGGATLSQYFALIGSGGHGLVDLAGFPRPALYVFQQLRYFTGEALPASIESADQTGAPPLWVHAARDQGRVQVLVSNIGTHAQALSTVLPGQVLIGAKTVTAQNANDDSGPAQLRLAATLDLPARSLTRLAYRTQ
jgi:Glycosyl hydrolases family 39